MKFKINNIIPIFLSIVVVGILFWVETTPFGENLIRDKLNNIIIGFDYMRYDVKSSILIAKNPIAKNKNKIIIINISDTNSPLKSHKVSYKYITIQAVIKKLLEGKPKIIASDIIITHPLTELAKDMEEILDKKILSSLQTLKLLRKYDEDFLNLICSNHVILPILQTQSKIQFGTLPPPILKLKNPNFPLHNINGYIANYPELQKASKANGFTSALINENYASNSNSLLVKNGTDVYPSLALAIAMQMFPERKISLNTTKIGSKNYLKFIQFGSQIIPTGGYGDLFTPFNKGVFAPQIISASTLLSENFAMDTISDAIIILNTNMDPLRNNLDILQTRYNIDAQVSMLNSILNEVYLYSPYWTKLLNLYLIITFGIIITLSFRILTTGISLIISGLLYICLFLTNFLAFYYANIVLNISAVFLLGLILILINMIFSWLFEEHKKIYIRKFFAQYVPPTYLNLLLENPNAYGFEGKSKDLTVLFADIRNFTGISEHLDANGVKKILNQFFTPMTSVILKNGGTVDKYVGDMVMAFFGAPVDNDNHRECALFCALEMLAYTKKMRKTFISQGLPPLELSIGLNSGVMNVGDMGSEFRRSYTVIGDAVNLGARIQSITAYYGVKLLVGSNTCANQTKFVFRMIDKVKLKGKSESETIYEVVGRAKNIRPYVLQEIQEHQIALNAYFAKNWDLAIHLFSILADKYPNYKVYTIFLERSENYKIHNPPEDWDGAHTFSEK